MASVHGGGFRIVKDDPDGKQFAHRREVRFSTFDLNGRVHGANLHGVYEPDKKTVLFKKVENAATGNFRAFDTPNIGRDAAIYDRILKEQSTDELPDIAAVAALGVAMMDGTGGETIDGHIPAAYTYLGQFIAHDITKMVQLSGHQPTNGRTAILDLDSVFGEIDTRLNPAPDVHCNGGLMLGTISGAKSTSHSDLPRTRYGQAIIPDDRNDHNLAVAQFHVALVKFHQSVCILFPNESAEEQRTITRRHFQAIVLLDYLKRIIDPEVYRDVMNNRRAVVYREVDPEQPFLIPIEFSAACFRFGHSMVRSAYQPWGKQQEVGVFEHLVKNTYRGGALIEGKLEHSWVVNWPGLLRARRSPDRVMAGLIDTKLTQELFDLREWPGLFPAAGKRGAYESANLAARTLMRGHSLGIPSAQVVLEHVASRLDGRPALQALSDDKLIEVSNPLVAKCLVLGNFGKRLQNRTPLWFYVLRESEHFCRGQRLGPLASRIVFETIHASIQEDPLGIIDKEGKLNFAPEAAVASRRDHKFLLKDMFRCINRVWHT
jgi:hypothetical protein